MKFDIQFNLADCVLPEHKKDKQRYAYTKVLFIHWFQMQKNIEARNSPAQMDFMSGRWAGALLQKWI